MIFFPSFLILLWGGNFLELLVGKTCLRTSKLFTKKTKTCVNVMATPQVLVRLRRRRRLYLQLRLSQSPPCEGTPFFSLFENVFLVQLHLVILRGKFCEPPKNAKLLGG